MEEKYELRFTKIEKWIEENPDEAVGVVFTALMERARQNENDVKRVWDSIRTLAIGIENWPICRCGRSHLPPHVTMPIIEPMFDAPIPSEQPQTPSYEVIPTADGLMVVDVEDIELGLFDDELRELEED